MFKSSGFAVAFSSATSASSSTSQPLTRLRVSSFDFMHVIVTCSVLPVSSLCSALFILLHIYIFIFFCSQVDIFKLRQCAVVQHLHDVFSLSAINKFFYLLSLLLALLVFHSRPLSLLAYSAITWFIRFKLFSFNYYLFIYLLYSLFSTEETTRTQRQ